MADRIPDRDVEALIQGYLEGDLSPEDAGRLEAALRENPGWAKVLLDHLRDHQALGEVMRESEAVAAGLRASRTRLRAARQAAGPARAPWLAAAAAALLIAGLAAWRAGGGTRPGAARSMTPRTPDNALAGSGETPGAPAAPEIARLEAERRRLRERLESLERERQRAAAPTDRPADAPAADAPGRDLTRIESDRKAVEEEMAWTVEAMRRARGGTQDVVPPAPEAPPSTTTGGPHEAATEAAVAVIETVDGTAWLGSPEGERSAARAGGPVFAGRGIATEGAKSRATLVFADRTRVELGGETRVARVEEAPASVNGAGKRLQLAAGTLVVDAVRQPKSRPLVVITPHAEATVQGTRFTISADASRTSLQVERGEVQLGNAHGAVQVLAGLASAATAGAAPAAPAAFRPAGPSALRVIDNFAGPLAWTPVPKMPLGCELADVSAAGGRRSMRLTFTPRENGKEYGFVMRPVDLKPSDRAVRLHALVEPGSRPPRDAVLSVHLGERDGDVWALDSQNRGVRDLGTGWLALDYELPSSEKGLRRTETPGDGRLDLAAVSALLVGIWGQMDGKTSLFVGGVAVVEGPGGR
jgi:ferric-dicitrate binding protein FerR (iron transport regulator)